MVDDPNDGEITGIGLTPSSLTGSRTAYTDDPVARLGTDCVDSHFFGAAIKHNLKVLVFEIRDPVRRDQRLDDLDNQHDQWASC